MVEIKPAEATAPNSKEAHLTHVKNIFKTATLDVFQLYKQSLRAVDFAHLQGKEEAFNEVMKFVAMQNTNHDFRYIQISEMITYIQSRYKAHREECEARNQALLQTGQNSDFYQNYLSQRQAPGNDNFHLARAESEVQSAVDNLANQARTIAEEQGPLTHLQSRLQRLNFDIFKVKGTKKRKHPEFSNQQGSPPIRSSENMRSARNSTMQDSGYKHFKTTINEGQNPINSFGSNNRGNGRPPAGNPFVRQENSNTSAQRPEFPRLQNPASQAACNLSLAKIDFSAFLPERH